MLPTKWSRGAGIAGRDVADIRIVELCRNGFAEHPLRLLSGGRFQGVIFTRNVAESVFVANLLKSLREFRVDLDAAASACFPNSGEVPDKHKDSAKFMGPLVSLIVQEVRAKLPASQLSGDTELELERARKKLPEHNIPLTPQKRESPDESDTQAGANPSGSAKDLPAAKRRKLPTEEEASELTGMLSGPPKHECGTFPDSHTEESVQSWVEQFRRQFKGKQQEFKVHLDTAIRMNIKSLTTLIAALQFEAA